MGAALDNATLIEHQDLVRLLQRDQPVRDRDRGPIPHQVPDRRHQLALGDGVEVGGGLIEDEQRSVFEQRPRHGQPLALAPGEPRTLLPDVAVQPGGKPREEPAELRRL